MSVLSIGTDNSIFDEESALWRRHRTFCGYVQTDVLVLKSGEAEEKATKHGLLSMPGGANKVVALFRTLRKALQLVRENEYDLIATQDVLYAGVVGYLASRKAKKPLVVQLHGDYLDNPKWFASGVGTFNRLMNPVGKAVLRRADGVRVVSNRIKKEVLERFGVDEARVVSLPIGSNDTAFGVGTGERGTDLLFVGRLLPEKDPKLFVDIALDVLKKYPDTKVTLAGDGPMRAELEKRIAGAERSDAFHFLGNVNQAVLAKAYQSSKMLVHTAGWEGWGMPMIEAMACGCVVVTNDTGCAGEAVCDGETGLVVAGDKESFVAGVEGLLSNQTELERLSQAGLLEAKEWSEGSQIQKIATFYETIANRKQ